MYKKFSTQTCQNYLYILKLFYHYVTISFICCRVITLGGTGEQGTDKVGGKPGPLQPISSPWDVARVNEKCVAVAMAGIHQVFKALIYIYIYMKIKAFFLEIDSH